MRALLHLYSDVIITAVISVEPYLVDKGLHTALDKIYKNVDIKTSNIIILIIVRILYSSYTAPAHVNTYTHERTHARAHAHTHTHTHTHRGEKKEYNEC